MSGTSVVPPSVAVSRPVPANASAPSGSHGRTKSGIEVTIGGERAAQLARLPRQASVAGDGQALGGELEPRHLGEAGVEHEIGAGDTGFRRSAGPARWTRRVRGRSARSIVPSSSKLAWAGPPMASSDSETSTPDWRAARTARPMSLTSMASGPLSGAGAGATTSGQRAVPEARTVSSNA